MIENKLTAVDLFCGCGGLTLGLSRAGFDTVCAFDNDQDALNTFGSHHPAEQLHAVDITTLAEDLEDYEIPSTLDLLCGGPPCQGFSGYNRFRSSEDERNDLVSRFLDVASVLHPRAVLIENVVGILSSGKGEVPYRLLDALDELGYRASLHILQAGGYGVPQNRWRVFVVGFKEMPQSFVAPEPTHFFPRMPMWGATKWRDAVVHPLPPSDGMLPLAKPTVTVGDAISDLPSLANGGSLPPTRYNTEPLTEFQRQIRENADLIHNHCTKRLGDLQLTRVRHIPKRPNAGWNDLPDELKPDNLVRQGEGSYDNRFGRLWQDGIFNTILTDAHLYWGRVIHPTDDRVISVRESARAQVIPDRVVLSGRASSQYRQVGNAVPPPVAEALGRTIARHLNSQALARGDS